MNKGPRLYLLAIAALLLAGCGRPKASAMGDFEGTLRSGCAPHDAASTVIELTSTRSSSRVWLNLWPAAQPDLPAVIGFEQADRDGQGAFCISPDSCATAAWAEVSLEPASDGSIRGTWRMGLESGETVEGTLQAEWLLIQALCG